ncbi:peptide/nickel transport system substrate-binding protein [Amphibacillus marinus]|uniref:Peptide/nickel transport system substrate-binding protein n=1 Tax=Amphibacillus marinus TaxID=872970 RepID=A0A1H8S744_9BACI|nr:ABC transporter substrate-binding protein [Amphibacillus marinus]SEO74422.1 peptide/nickel transport system substrate-binding protein [Amphibacillus marinus]
MASFKKITLLIMIMFGMVFFLVACGGGEGTETTGDNDGDPSGDITSDGEEEDTLYIGLTNAPGGFNPLNASDTVAQWILRMLYPTLLEQPESLVFDGNLAESFETEDNQSFTITLRPDAEWSDGEPITADDVAYTLELIANPDVETTWGVNISSLEGLQSTGKWEDGAAGVAGVEVVDEQTLILTTKTPVDPNYIKEMIGFNVYIVPKHIAEQYEPAELANSDFATTPSVSGSIYQFVQYETDAYVQLEANPTFYKGEAQLKHVYLRVVNGTSLVTELQSGGVDMAAGGGIGVVPVSEVDTLAADDNLDFESYPGFATQFMFINNEEFDADVRLAMMYAIDREAIVEQLFRGNAEVLNSTYTSASVYFDPNVEAIPHDVDRARELLEESGFDTSQEIELTVPTGNRAREQSASLIQQNLAEAGFNVTQVTFDFVTALANVREGDYQIGLIGIPLTSDPDQTYLWSQSGTTNLGRVNDERMEDLLEQGRTSTSMEERQEIYSELQEYWRDQAFSVGLYGDFQYKVQNKELNGGIKEFWGGSLHDMHEWTKD